MILSIYYSYYENEIRIRSSVSNANTKVIRASNMLYNVCSVCSISELYVQ